MAGPTPSAAVQAVMAAEAPPLEQHAPRKVALLVEPTPFTHVSGYSNRFKEMLRFLQQGGDDAAVITPDNSADRPDNFLGMPITYVRGFRWPLYPAVQLSVDFGLRGWRRLRDFRPDLIHAAAPGWLIMPAIVYSRLLRVPLVISYHTHLAAYADQYVTIPGLKQFFIWLANRVIPFILNWSDLTLATSEPLQAQLKELGCKNVEVWRKGVDTRVFSPEYNVSNGEMREYLTGGRPEKPLLLYVGRLGQEKNIGLLKQALDAVPSAALAVVGEGPAEAELKALFAGRDVVFTGLLSGEPLSRAYACADCFVMPSESETLGFVVLEAMASGLPTVCANAGGLPSLVNDGVTGFLFAPGDADELASKVRALLADADLRKRMGDAGRAETLGLNWRAATSILRNEQYTAAESHFRQRRGLWRSIAGWRRRGPAAPEGQPAVA